MRLAILLLVLASCSTAKHVETAVKPAVVDCAKEYAPSAAAILARWAAGSAVAGKPDWAALERDAATLAIPAGTCLYAEALAAWRAKPTVQALTMEPLPDDGSAGLERLRAAAGGTQVRLVGGAVM